VVMNRRSVVFLFVVFGMVSSPLVQAEEVSKYSLQNPQAALLQKVRFEQKLDNQIPLDAKFLDENGNSVMLGRYFGDKPVILALVYYECPMLCTLVLNGLSSTLKGMNFDVGNQFEVVVLSFDPEETPELAKKKKEMYVKAYGRKGADNGWHFLTGTQENINRVTDAVGFQYQYDPEIDQYAHASGIIAMTPKGKVAKYFYGVEYAPRDVKFALMQASTEKIGTITDQILLFCFHYDPITGKYSFAIMNFIRIAGLLTIAVLGSFIFLMLRRDRQQPKVS